MSERVTLCDVPFNVSRPEPWAVVFTEHEPIGGRPMRFMLSRGSVFDFWRVSPAEGYCDLSCQLVNGAYEWCKQRVGDDFATEPLPDRPIVPHDWGQRPDGRTTYCVACGQDMLDSVIHQSCANTWPERRSTPVPAELRRP
jgi:hypothetical protein